MRNMNRGGHFISLIAFAPFLAFADVSPPVFDPGEGDSPALFNVILTCGTPGASIHYTLDGSEPTESDASVVSGSSVEISRDLVLKAKAWSGSETSVTTTAVYRLTGDVAAGAHHVLSVDFAGNIQAWGEQLNGRLANGQSVTANITTPGPAKYSSSANIEDAIAVGAGLNHSLFIKRDRSVWSFGNNSNGQLGDTTVTSRTYPVRVRKSSSTTDYLGNCVAVYGGSSFSGALGSNRKVYMWGVQTGGRLGNGVITGSRSYAGFVKRGDTAGNPDLEGIASMAVGGGFALAREPSAMEEAGALGRVWTWGHNPDGQLGQGGTANKSYAYTVKLSAGVELTDAWHASAGGAHGVIVRWKDGTPNLQGSVWSFGNGTSGRLGRNSTANSSYPVQVVTDTAGTPLSNVNMVAAGSAHTLALDKDGKVWAWGYNAYGAVGNGTTTDAHYAVPVLNPDGSGQLGDQEEGEIVWIAAGGEGAHNTSYAISERGNVYGWGRNDDGELGNGTVTSGATSLPAKIPALDLVPGFPNVSLAHVVTQTADPGSVTLTASPSDPDGADDIAAVKFYLGGVLVSTVTSPPWQHSAGALAAGVYEAHAVVADAAGNEGISGTLNFTINPSDPNSDADEDGLTYSQELALETNPDMADTDGDGMGDGYEHYYDLSPLSAADGDIESTGAAVDADLDGMRNKDEFDRGTIPTNALEEPAQTGTAPNRVVKWWGVAGVTYHLKYSTDPGMAGAVTHSTPFAGQNAEITVLLSTLTGTPVPSPLYVRLVAASDVPALQLTVSYPDGVAPETVTLSPQITHPVSTASIAAVDFYLQGVRVKRRTTPPFTHAVTNLGSGSYQAYVIVTDSLGRRGWSETDAFTIAPPAAPSDDDSDGMTDSWELEHFGNLDQGASDDADGDGVSNYSEFVNGTNPLLMDSDGDGIPDGEDLTPLSPNYSAIAISGALRVLTPDRP